MSEFPNGHDKAPNPVTEEDIDMLSEFVAQATNLYNSPGQQPGDDESFQESLWRGAISSLNTLEAANMHPSGQDMLAAAVAGMANPGTYYAKNMIDFIDENRRVSTEATKSLRGYAAQKEVIYRDENLSADQKANTVRSIAGSLIDTAGGFPDANDKAALYACAAGAMIPFSANPEFNGEAAKVVQGLRTALSQLETS